MRLDYNPKDDVLRVVLAASPVKTRDREKPGVVLGYGQDGNLVDFEIRNASQCIENPKSLDYAVAGTNIRGLRIL